jgi:MFS family permease
MQDAAERIRRRLRRLVPRLHRGLIFPLVAIIGLATLGGAVGRILALGLLPLLWSADEDEPARSWRPRRDLAMALAAGTTLALLSHFLWSPYLIEGFPATGSDVGEHMWLLHHMNDPGWPDWNANRYPLPVLLARLLAFSGNAYKTWLLAAVVSMGFVGAGLYLWGRAVGGVGTGLAVVLLVGAVPDLALMSRVVSSYPEILALWTLGAGLAAYALRFPHWATALAAGVGCGAVFASDARGVVPGALILVVCLAAALGQRSMRSRGLAVVLVCAPVALSFLIHNQLPQPLKSLEMRTEGTVQASYHRVGEDPPRFAGISGGYVWGRSNPLEFPTTIRNLRASQARLNPAIATSDQQRQDVERRVEPLLWPLGVLAALGLLLGGAFPRWRELREPRAWVRWIDWRGRLALLPVVACVIWYVNTVSYEYFARFMALAAPGFLLLAGLGLVALGGRGRPAVLAPVVALLVLQFGGPLSVQARWRVPLVANPELRECVEIARGDSSGQPSRSVENCVRALRQRVFYRVASPLGERIEPEGGPEHPGPREQATW